MTLLSLLVLVSSAFGLHAHADSLRVGRIPNTVDVIEAAVRDLTDSIIVRSGITAGDSLPLFVHEHPDASWVRSIVARRMEERGLPVVLASEQVRADLELVVMDVSTRYAPLPDRDSLERQVVVKLGTSYRRRAIALEPQVDRFVVARSAAAAAQSMQHFGAHATLPDAPSSLWEDALEPLIYIAAAVVTIVLLFTVRTQ